MELLSQELKEVLQPEIQSIICTINQHEKLLDLIANKSFIKELSIAIKVEKFKELQELDYG